MRSGQPTQPQIVVPDTRDALSRARRTPARCLYCAAPATSWEHAVPEALGGRLQAPILCPTHNNSIAAAADEPLIKQFQPLAHMLDIKRQSGKRGTSFRARTDSGERVVVERDGHVRRYKRLDVVTKGKSGKINYAKGDLAALHDLKKHNALEDPSKPVIITMERAPIVNFQIAVAHDTERGALKIALHFVAGFASDIDHDVSRELLPYVLGTNPRDGEYVRAAPLNSTYFPTSWPPCHEIRTYPAGRETFVTVLFFGICGYQVRLPIATAEPLRYFQPLIDSVQPIFERNDHVRTFDWNNQLTAGDREALEANLRHRYPKFEMYASWRIRRDQCRKAALRASASMYTLRTSFLEAYRAELQQEAFSADDVALCVAFAREAIRTGRLVWDFPFEYFAA